MNDIEKFEDSVKLCNQRDILRQEADEYQELVDAVYLTPDEYKRVYFQDHAPKILLLILSIVLGFVLGSIVIASYGDSEFVVGTAVPLIVILSPFFFYNVVLKRLFYAIKRKEFIKYERLLDQAILAKPEIIKVMNETRQQQYDLETLMRDDSICIIPEMYWDNANMLYALIKNKRAHDIESAINEFEAILHRMRMENMAQESLEWQRISAYNSEIAAKNAQIAAENSRIAANNSEIAATYSILNYYS